jgi:hypothetical protein
MTRHGLFSFFLWGWWVVGDLDWFRWLKWVEVDYTLYSIYS